MGDVAVLASLVAGKAPEPSIVVPILESHPKCSFDLSKSSTWLEFWGWFSGRPEALVDGKWIYEDLHKFGTRKELVHHFPNFSCEFLMYSGSLVWLLEETCDFHDDLGLEIEIHHITWKAACDISFTFNTELFGVQHCSHKILAKLYELLLFCLRKTPHFDDGHREPLFLNIDTAKSITDNTIMYNKRQHNDNKKAERV